MLGDLGYADSFLNQDTPVKYPYLANGLFVVFVTAVAWLIFNLILTSPTQYLEHIRQKARFHRADTFMKLQLRIDDCLPFVRRRFTVIKHKFILYGKRAKKLSKCYARLPDEKDNDEKDISSVNKGNHEFNETLIDMQNQLKLLIQRTIENNEQLRKQGIHNNEQFNKLFDKAAKINAANHKKMNNVNIPNTEELIEFQLQ